jgi:hypothetical protein
MWDALILAYVQYVVMLIELKKVLSQEVKCLCSKTTTFLLEWSVPESMDVILLHFIALKINKYIV